MLNPATTLRRSLNLPAGGGITAPKMFPFTQVSKCTLGCKLFMSHFNNLERNSGQCETLRASIIKCQALICFLQKETGTKLDFALPGFLPEDFVSNRIREEKTILEALHKSISEGQNFQKAFTDIRLKNMKDFGENKNVAKFTKKNIYLKNYNVISKALAEHVDKWEAFLKEEVGPELAGFFENTVDGYIKTNTPETFVIDGTISVVSELKERLRQQNDKKVDWKRIEVLLPAVEDINDSLKHAQLQVLLENARKRLARRGRNYVPVDPIESIARLETDMLPVAVEDVVHGVQSFGPFATNSLQERYRNLLDFANTEKSRQFEVDLSQFTEDLEEYKVVGKISNSTVFHQGSAPMRRKIRAPASAMSYAWIYPVGDINLRIPEDVLNEHPADLNYFSSLLRVGGIVYFNKENQVIKVSSLEPDQPQFAFTGPYRLGKNMDEMLEQLQNTGRWVDVQVEDLRESGATDMVWLTGGEIPDVDNPCMMFRYGNEHEPTYFTMITMSAIEATQRGGLRDSYKRLKEVLDSYMPHTHNNL